MAEPHAPRPDRYGAGPGAESRLGPGAEFDLIRRVLARQPRPARGDVLEGPGDDAAVVAGEGIVLSSDLSVEDVHFRRAWLSAREIGYRAAAAALSDLAAMAARPIGVLVSVGAAAADAGEFLVELMAGVHEAVEAVDGVVLGGDVTRSPGPLVVDVTVVGEAATPVRRRGAEPGDELWVTGELGGAALVVERLLAGGEVPAAARPRFARPLPRVREALWLSERGVLRAMLDLSDGLAGDAGHLAAASGIAVVLERDAVPVHPAVLAARPETALALATTGGEDYELCFAAPPGRVAELRERFTAELGVPLTRVGRVEEGKGVFWRADDGGRVPVGRGGFQHFGETT